MRVTREDIEWRHSGTESLQENSGKIGANGGEARGRDYGYETGGDARRLAEGYKFHILVSLRVFWAKPHHI